jgi:phosphoglycolate phosphatase-like HAD superfamily hydrolase
MSPLARAPALLLALALSACSLPASSRSAAPARSEVDRPSSGIELADGSTIPNLATIKGEIVRYHDSGLWEAAVGRIADQARARLDELLPESRRPALVLDIDDTALSTYSLQRRLFFGYTERAWNRWMEDQSPPPHPGILRLFRYAKRRGIAVFFVTGRREPARQETARQLRTAGYEGWDGIFLKPSAYREPSVVPYKSGARAAIEAQGYEILVNVGDQWSDLEGGHALASFKLPNPIYIIP